MPGSNGSAEAEEGGTGSDDESWTRGLSSPRWARMPGGTKGWRLRGVEWRVKLGILPGGTATVDAMRRATADGRRRYADVRRRLLVDPHLIDDDQKASRLSMDNPLSLDPESIWGRYFRNAELEKTIEKDLTRLYPEHGVFFQSSPCQAMMRRILLVWSLIHQQFSYRQGMHELLAPLLYVLHVDVVRLSQVKHRFEDLFDDRFDSLSLQEQHVRDKVESAKNFCGEMIVAGDSINFNEKVRNTKDAGPYPEEQRVDLSVIVQGSDMYGVEGELGALLSARFLEHDAYCMLDALLGGQGGPLAMADYFTTSTGGGKPPVIEGSAALFRTLAAADISLYSHLVELGVEPQYFALRWLRLLFGREFVLEDLLRVWDAIFEADNIPLCQSGGEDSSEMKISKRSALISSMSVSMLLYVRPALLAAPDATACLQRLLNFPRVPDVRDLIESAKSLQLLAQAAAKAPGPPVPRSARSSEIRASGKHVRSGSISPPTPQHHVVRHQNANCSSPDVLRVSMSLPGSYWEEKWTNSVLQKKTPEDLFSPRTRTEAVVRSENVDREVSTTTRMLNRSTSEGRHQAVRPEPLAPKSIRPFDCYDSSDDDGQEMLRRCGETSNRHASAEGFRADSVSHVKNGGGSPESGDSDGLELRDQSLLNSEDVLLASTSALEPQYMSTDRSSEVIATRSIMQPSCPKAFEPDGGEDNYLAVGPCLEVADDAEGRVNPLETCEDTESMFSDLVSERDSMGDTCGHVRQPVPQTCQIQVESNIDEKASSIAATPTDVSLETEDTAQIIKGSVESTSGRSPLNGSGTDFQGSSNDPHCEDGSAARESVKVRQEVQGQACTGNPSLVAASSEGLEDQAGHQHMEGEDSRSAESSPLRLKTKVPLTPSRLGRFNWMWSLGRNSFGEKTGINKLSKEESAVSEVNSSLSVNTGDTDMPGSAGANISLRRKKSWWRSNSDVVPEECVAASPSASNTGGVLGQFHSFQPECDPPLMISEVKLKDDVLTEVPVIALEAAKKPKDMTPSAALQALGQSVLEHVQVLESALAQKVSVLGIENMMWTPAVRERSDSINRTGLGGKGQGAALAAIAELRKISQALQQM